MVHGENHITVIDDEGNEQLCEILFTFDSDEFDKSYVVYSPIGVHEDEDEEIEVFASVYVPSEDGEEGNLLPIESEEEWDLVEEMLNTFSFDEKLQK